MPDDQEGATLTVTPLENGWNVLVKIRHSDADVFQVLGANPVAVAFAALGRKLMREGYVLSDFLDKHWE